jgi:ATP/maltotriose-dependent transcriptional regulator MalT
MLSGDYEESLSFGRQALAMADELGLDDLRAAVLTNVGSTRVALGDEEGIADLEQAVAAARTASAGFELSRAKGNLASQLWLRGSLREADRLWDESDIDASQYGQMGFARWFRALKADKHYALGRWDDALSSAQAFIAEVEAGEPHYLASQVYATRALVHLGRDDDSTVQSDAEKAVDIARRAKDPQILYLTLACAAHLHRELGDREKANALADEFLAATASGQELAFSIAWLHVVAWTLTEAGRGPELAAAAARYAGLPWARAGIAFAEGDPVRAADICAEMGAVTEEAYARLAAARMLSGLAAGDQLHRALAFYRSVGAGRYVQEGEALLAASA